MALLTRAGHEVVFATEQGGAAPAADPLLLDGVLFGQLGADRRAEAPSTRDRATRPTFRAPIAVGRHRRRRLRRAAPARRPRARACASTSARRCCRQRSRAFWRARPPGRRHLPRRARAGRARATRRPARACSPAAAPPACRSTWSAAPTSSTVWKLGRYYRTYPAYVEDEVRAALARPGAVRARPARAHERGTDDRRRRAPSSSRTAATSPRAGPATPTCSRAASPPACSGELRHVTRSRDEFAQRRVPLVVVALAQDRRRDGRSPARAPPAASPPRGRASASP